MAQPPSILPIARVAPPAKQGVWLLAIYWVLVATFASSVATRALATVGSSPRGVIITVVAVGGLIISALFAARLRRTVWDMMTEGRAHSQTLRRLISAQPQGTGEPTDAADATVSAAQIYQAVFAAEGGKVPGPARLAVLEERYRITLPRIWISAPSSARFPLPRSTNGTAATSRISRASSAPLDFGSRWRLIVFFAGIVCMLGCVALSTVGRAPAAGLPVWLTVGLLFAGTLGICLSVYTTPHWSVLLHARGIVLERRSAWGQRVIERVEVALGVDALSLSIDQHGQARIGIDLASRSLRVWGGPVALPDEPLWRLLVS